MDHEAALALRRTQWIAIAILAGGGSSGSGPGFGPGGLPRVTSRVDLALARRDGTCQLRCVRPENQETLLPAHERVTAVGPEVLFFLYWVYAMPALGIDHRDRAEQEKTCQAKPHRCCWSHNYSPST